MIHHGFDIDDFVLLKLLLEKNKLGEIGKIMGLSQPAISARLRTISERLLVKLHVPDGRGIVLTAKGAQLAAVATSIVDLLVAFKLEADKQKPRPVAIKTYSEQPVNEKPEIPFKISGRNMCFSYMEKK